MPRYSVSIPAILTFNDVEANSFDHAEERAEEMIESGHTPDVIDILATSATSQDDDTVDDGESEIDP
jgi:hypothetical protein